MRPTIASRSPGMQSGERVFVAPAIFFVDRQIQWRRAAIGRGIGQLGWRRVTGRVTKPISNAVQQRSTKVAEQRAFALWLERAEVADRLQDRFLHDICRIHGISCPSGNAPVRPAMQRGEIALEESIERAVVAGACAAEQFERWGIGHRRSRHCWPNHIAPQAHLGTKPRHGRQGWDHLQTCTGGMPATFSSPSGLGMTSGHRRMV